MIHRNLNLLILKLCLFFVSTMHLKITNLFCSGHHSAGRSVLRGCASPLLLVCILRLHQNRTWMADRWFHDRKYSRYVMSNAEQVSQTVPHLTWIQAVSERGREDAWHPLPPSRLRHCYSNKFNVVKIWSSKNSSPWPALHSSHTSISTVWQLWSILTSWCRPTSYASGRRMYIPPRVRSKWRLSSLHIHTGDKRHAL
jgi:hypothetical protein